MCPCRARKCICSFSWARWRRARSSADRSATALGARRVIWGSILGVLPFSLLLPHVNLFWTGLLSVPIGMILASAFPAILVYAQELLPGKIGMISGLFFGLAFGMAGVAAAVLGNLADHMGIDFVYQLCAFLPAIGILTAFLPDVGQAGRFRSR